MLEVKGSRQMESSSLDSKNHHQQGISLSLKKNGSILTNHK